MFSLLTSLVLCAGGTPGLSNAIPVPPTSFEGAQLTLEQIHGSIQTPGQEWRWFQQGAPPTSYSAVGPGRRAIQVAFLPMFGALNEHIVTELSAGMRDTKEKMGLTQVKQEIHLMDALIHGRPQFRVATLLRHAKAGDLYDTTYMTTTGSHLVVVSHLGPGADEPEDFTRCWRTLRFRAVSPVQGIESHAWLVVFAGLLGALLALLLRGLAGRWLLSPWTSALGFAALTGVAEVIAVGVWIDTFTAGQAMGAWLCAGLPMAFALVTLRRLLARPTTPSVTPAGATPPPPAGETPG